MTPTEAWELWRRWYGTAEIRHEPTDGDLRKHLRTTRAAWDQAVTLVKMTAEPRANGVQVFICRPRNVPDQRWTQITARVEAATPRAVLLRPILDEDGSVSTEQVWVPRSQLQDGDHEWERGDEDCFDVARWLAEQHGW